MLSTDVLNAAFEVNQLVGGLNVLTQEPIDITNQSEIDAASPDELVYSALVAAVLSRASEAAAGGEVDLDDIIDQLSNDVADGVITVADLRDILTEAQEQLLGAGESDASGVFSTLDAQLDEAETAGQTSFDPVDRDPNAPADAISRARTLVGNVRDTLNGLNDLEAPAEAFGDQVDMAAALLDPADTDNPDGTTTPVLGPVDFLFEGLGYVLGLASDCVDANTTEDTQGNKTIAPGTCDDGDPDALPTPIPANFTVEITESNSSQITVAVEGEDDNVNANLTAVFPNNAGRATAQTLNASFTGTVATTADGTGLQLSIPSPGATATLTKTSSGALDDNNDATDDGKRISSASFSMPGITLAQTNAPAACTSPGQTDPPCQDGGEVSFTGVLGATIVRCTKQSCVDRENLAQQPDSDNGLATFVPSAFNLSGTFSNNNAQNSTTMLVEVSVANAANFDPLLSEELQGEDGDLVTADNFPDATVTLRFDADLGDVAPALVVLIGDLNGIFTQPETDCGSSPCPAGATHSDPNASASLTLLRGDPLAQVLRIQANTVDESDRTGFTATISDSAGAALVIEDRTDSLSEGTEGIVRVDGVQVGEIRELSTGLVIIRYEDGTFETLF